MCSKDNGPWFWELAELASSSSRSLFKVQILHVQRLILTVDVTRGACAKSENLELTRWDARHDKLYSMLAPWENELQVEFGL